MDIRGYDSGVKIIVLGIIAATSISLLHPAQADSRASMRSHYSAPQHSAPASHLAGRPGNSAATRYYGSSPRFYSGAMNRSGVYAASSPRFSTHAAFRNRTGGERLAVNHNSAIRSQGFNNSQRVIARHSASWRPNWSRSRDHLWHGHRCHWRNNTWVIFDTGLFYPYGYGYGYGSYPYGSYYGGGYYDNSYASNDYSQQPYSAQSGYDSGNTDSSVSQLQSLLTREGYYHGPIDGSLGPATRKALRRYQRDHGVDARTASTDE